MNMTKKNNDAAPALSQIAIIGLGLMGGSMALALKGKVATLIGYDKKVTSREDALELGVVHEVADQIDEAVARADMVVLATPVDSIAALIRSMPEIRPEGCMILDLGSTKREIEAAMERLPVEFTAIGGHPMCGRESSGLAAATADLYRGETFILCRNSRTTNAIETTALSLIEQIGAKPLFMSADDHDNLVAASSHLPYVVSAVLMRVAWNAASDDDRLWPVSASGLRDTTRLAGSSPEMMLEIMMTNRAPLLAEINRYREELDTVEATLRQRDWIALRAILESAHQQRDDYVMAKHRLGDSAGEMGAAKGDDNVSSSDGIG